ncbi:MAG: ion transporter [Prevotella sp.]
MKKIKTDNPFTLVIRAFNATKREMWLSLQLLFCITAILALILFYFEHQAQPEVFAHFWQSLAWTVTRYLDNIDGIVTITPITIEGKMIAIMLGIVAIAIVAIPAGLIGSGFMDAIAEDKRKKEIEGFKLRLKKSFRRKQCRHTKYRTVPHYVSVVDIQAKQGIDTKDILDAVNVSGEFRLRNLATTQPLGEKINDRLVVEQFPVNTPYGCKIDRNSNVTIVSTSSVSEASIGNFAWYLALYGGFNYVSKEVECDPDEPFSYYNIANEDGDPNIETFLSDIKAMERSEKNWVVMLLSASGAEEPTYPSQIHWIHGAKRGDSGYGDPNITVRDTAAYDSLYKACETMAYEKFGYKSDRQEYHTGASKMYIGRHVDGGRGEVNAFTLRIAFEVTVWDDRRIAIAKEIASLISRHLTGKDVDECLDWKSKGIGYEL